MLVRKLKQKHIDCNPAFAVQIEDGTSTCNLLQNNFVSAIEQKSRKFSSLRNDQKNQLNSNIEYGSVPQRQSSIHLGKTRNVPSQGSRFATGQSNNILPRIMNPNQADEDQALQETPKTRRTA